MIECMNMPVFIAEEIGRTLVGDELWLPTVSIDVSQHPSVADLARVHAIEGIGDVSTHMIRENDSVVIGVRVNIPVTAAFAVVFSYKNHAEFLQEVADTGSLVFATTNTLSAGQDQPLWLSVDIDGESLLRTLNGVEH